MNRCTNCSFENDELRKTCGACGSDLGTPLPSPHSIAEMYPAPDPVAEHEILRLLREGKKIMAIKIHREATGLGLKESKEAVEALAQRHGLSNVTPANTGGLVLALGAVLLAIAAAMMFL